MSKLFSSTVISSFVTSKNVSQAVTQSFTASPAPVYWYGTNGDDRREGGGGYESVYAYGYGGNDYIEGGVADDILEGGDGTDILLGRGGNDILMGGNETDTVVGNDGNDVLYGGSGDDILVGGNGNDTVYGDDGHDVLVGDMGHDTLAGFNGNDRLNGYGGGTVAGDIQFDQLFGGEGADTFVLGDMNKVYYDELGFGDGYAVIKDFNYLEGDKIEVKGAATNYFLEVKSMTGIGSATQDTAIYAIRADGSRSLIAIAEDRFDSQVALYHDFNFV
jgi:Ca2+-binding RTX toxin-like protein